MANVRSQVAKVVIAGTLGPDPGPVEIWSTSFWVAAYGEGSPDTGPDDMGGFDPSAYLANQALAFAGVLGGLLQSFAEITSVKCNLFGITNGKVKQTNAITQEHQGRVGGGQVFGVGTFVTAMGWALGSTTGSRGLATHGRMFLPPLGSTNNSSPVGFNNLGQWTFPGTIPTALSSAWDALATAGAAGGGLTYLPSLVAAPTKKRPDTAFTVNAADITTLEDDVWVMRSRKNALTTGGTRSTHPTFS